FHNVAENVRNQQVKLLSDSRVGRGYAQRQVGNVLQPAGAPTGDRQNADAPVASRLGSSDEILGLAARAEGHQQVARPTEGENLAGENILEAVIVPHSSENRGVCRQRENGKGHPLTLEPADQLSGEMLRL